MTSKWRIRHKDENLISGTRLYAVTLPATIHRVDGFQQLSMNLVSRPLDRCGRWFEPSRDHEIRAFWMTVVQFPCKMHYVFLI